MAQGVRQQSRRAGTSNYRGKSDSQSGKKQGACHNCGQFGHWKAECPKKRNSETYKRTGQRPGPSLAFVALCNEDFNVHSSAPTVLTDCSAVSMQQPSSAPSITQSVIDVNEMEMPDASPVKKQRLSHRQAVFNCLPRVQSAVVPCAQTRSYN